MEESNYKNITDHEAILLIGKDIQSLKDSQTAFHLEMRESIAELKNNYQGTLNNHETRLVSLEATHNDFRSRVDLNNTYYKWTLLVVGLLFALMIWHLTGYKI